MSSVGHSTMGAHLLLPQSSKGRLGPAPHCSHNRFRGKAAGASEAEGHQGVLTLFLRPTTFHPSPSAQRWALPRSHLLTPAQRPPRPPPPHTEGTHQERGARAPHTLPRAGRKEHRFDQNPSPPPSLRPPSRSPRGPRSERVGQS